MALLLIQMLYIAMKKESFNKQAKKKKKPTYV